MASPRRKPGESGAETSEANDVSTESSAATRPAGRVYVARTRTGSSMFTTAGSQACRTWWKTMASAVIEVRFVSATVCGRWTLTVEGGVDTPDRTCN